MSSFGVFFILLVVATFVKNGSCNTTTESNLLALEVSGKLLAPQSLSQKLAKELKAIRTAYPEVNNVAYTAPWVASELLAKVSDEQLEKIRIKYGEVTARPLSGDSQVLKFTKQYNPEVLAKQLTANDMVEYAEPNHIIGGGNDIEYDPIGIYTFIQGWGDCPSGCIYKHYWGFFVFGNARVILLKEYGTDLGEEAEAI